MTISRKALILGCTGQDGGLLAKSLLNKGYRVTGTSRSSNPNLGLCRLLGIGEDLVYRSVNICDFRAMLELVTAEEPDEIYNLAAQSSVGLSFSQPTETFDSIILGAINLLEVCRFVGYKGRVFFAGSSEIFGNTYEPARIDSKRDPQSPYAIAKDTAFNAVRLYRSAYGLRCVTGVLFNHESPFRGDQYVTHKIIGGAIKCKKNHDYRLRLGNLNVSRDWGWAEEYVEAMQALMTIEPMEDHLICTGRMASLEYFVQTVFGLLEMNWRDHVIRDTYLVRPADIRLSVGDPGPMTQRTGWRAHLDVDNVIEKLLNYALDCSDFGQDKQKRIS